MAEDKGGEACLQAALQHSGSLPAEGPLPMRLQAFCACEPQTVHQHTLLTAQQGSALLQQTTGHRPSHARPNQGTTGLEFSTGVRVPHMQRLDGAAQVVDVGAGVCRRQGDQVGIHGAEARGAHCSAVAGLQAVSPLGQVGP